MQDRSPITPNNGSDLADRVETLERELSVLKARFAMLTRVRNAAMLDTFGAIPDDEMSREAERLGREYRDRQPKC